MHSTEIECHLFKENPSNIGVHFLVFLKMRLALCRSLLNIESVIFSKSLRELHAAAILFCYGARAQKKSAKLQNMCVHRENWLILSSKIEMKLSKLVCLIQIAG